LRLAVDVNVDDGVRVTDDQPGLVRGKREVLHIGAVAVQDGGNLAGGAEAAGEALTELGANVYGELVLVAHGCSWVCARRNGVRADDLRNLDSNATREETASGPPHRVDHGRAQAHPSPRSSL